MSWRRERSISGLIFFDHAPVECSRHVEVSHNTTRTIDTIQYFFNTLYINWMKHILISSEQQGSVVGLVGAVGVVLTSPYTVYCFLQSWFNSALKSVLWVIMVSWEIAVMYGYLFSERLWSQLEVASVCPRPGVGPYHTISAIWAHRCSLQVQHLPVGWPQWWSCL